MMTHVPQSVLDCIAAFQQARQTGQIVLHLKDGRIMQVDSNAMVKVKDSDAVLTA